MHNRRRRRERDRIGRTNRWGSAGRVSDHGGVYILEACSGSRRHCIWGLSDRIWSSQIVSCLYSDWYLRKDHSYKNDLVWEGLKERKVGSRYLAGHVLYICYTWISLNASIKTFIFSVQRRYCLVRHQLRKCSCQHFWNVYLASRLILILSRKGIAMFFCNFCSTFMELIIVTPVRSLGSDFHCRVPD